MDWSECEDVERSGQLISGAWVVRGTRIQADAVVENAADGYTAEEIAAIFPGVPVERVRGVIRFARLHAAEPRKRGLAERLLRLGARYAALPDADRREADQILGYDEAGLPR